MGTSIFEGTFRYDFWSIVLVDGVVDAGEYARASDSRAAHRRPIGLARGVASISTPQQWNSDAPISVRLGETFAPDEAHWDCVVEFDFACETRTLAFGELDGPGLVSFSVPIGPYRARWSGRGFDDAYAGNADDGVSPDSYRLELVPGTDTRPLVEIRRWPGFDAPGFFGA